MKRTTLDDINDNPRGGKRGPKLMAVKDKARDQAEAEPLPTVDWLALAIEQYPEPGPARDACYRDLIGLAEREEALRIECMAGSQVAARAANEVVRVRAQRMGWVQSGKATPKPVASQFADLPMFTDAEPVADDVDMNARLEQSFGATDDND